MLLSLRWMGHSKKRFDIKANFSSSNLPQHSLQEDFQSRIEQVSSSCFFFTTRVRQQDGAAECDLLAVKSFSIFEK